MSDLSTSSAPPASVKPQPPYDPALERLRLVRGMAVDLAVVAAVAALAITKTVSGDAAARVKRLPVLIDDTPGLLLEELLRRAKRMAARLTSARKKLGLLVVDYLQIVKVPHVSGRKKVDEIGEISKALKVLARELDCTVLALAQLSRESEREKRRPRMTDLRDCGQIEQDADWVGILWRGRHTESWQTELAICKQRTGQKTADITLGWQGHLTRFSDG